MPLAIGQERSIKLVDDVLGGNRMLVMVASKDPEAEEPGAGRALPRGRGRRRRAHDEGAGRLGSDPGPVRPARRARATSSRRRRTWSRASPRRPTSVVPSPELEGAPPERAVHLLADHRGAAVPARGAPARGREPRRPGRARPPDRGRAADQDRGEAAAARGARRHEAAAAPVRDPRARARAGRDRQQDPDARSSPRWTAGQREYFLRQQLRAIQEELGEVDEQQAETEELRKQLEEANLPEAVMTVAQRELGRFERLPPQSAEHGVIRNYLEWIASLPVVQVHRGQPRPEARARGARPRPLRHRAREGPHPRVPRGAEAEPGGAQLDRPLRRAARRGQDVARPLDRLRHGARVRAHLGGRRARRVRDPRPPAHLHRRDAGHDPPRAARRGLEQPGPDDRRDRQDGRGLPRRPGERDARGARPRAEHVASATTTSTCRSTSRTSSSSAPRTRSTRSRPRCSTAWRRSSCRATRTRRSARSRRATSCRARWSATGSASRRSRSRSRRSTASSTATRARRACARSSARSARSAARSRASSRRARAARSGSSAPRPSRSCSASRASSRRSSGARASPAWRPAWPGRPSAATCCSSRRSPTRATASSRSPASSAT